MAIFYWEVKLYPWPTVPVIKRFMRRIEHRGEVKRNSENLVSKNRIQSEIWSVFKLVNQGSTRRESLYNENNVHFVTFNKQFNKNVIVNEVTLLSCQNTTFLCVVLVGFSLNIILWEHKGWKINKDTTLIILNFMSTLSSRWILTINLVLYVFSVWYLCIIRWLDWPRQTCYTCLS